MKSDQGPDQPVDVPADLPLTPAGAEKTSRAGRNLPAAIAVAGTLVAIVVASLFFVKDAFMGLVALALIVGLLELRGALKSASIDVPVLPVATGGVLMLVSGYWADEPLATAAVAMVLTVIGILIWRLADGPDGFVRDATAGVFSLCYLFLMGVFVGLMLLEDDGQWRVAAFIVTTIASDTGGYAAGVLFGKHPLARTISPKKSWEGLAGSLLLGTLAGVLAVTLTLDGPWWAGVALGVVGGVGGTTGDLLESLIKRDLDIKDMSDLLPGHGGLMDRLDSLVIVAPLAWLVLYTMVPVSG